MITKYANEKFQQAVDLYAISVAHGCCSRRGDSATVPSGYSQNLLAPALSSEILLSALSRRNGYVPVGYRKIEIAREFHPLGTRPMTRPQAAMAACVPCAPNHRHRSRASRISCAPLAGFVIMASRICEPQQPLHAAGAAALERM